MANYTKQLEARNSELAFALEELLECFDTTTDPMTIDDNDGGAVQVHCDVADVVERAILVLGLEGVGGDPEDFDEDEEDCS